VAEPFHKDDKERNGSATGKLDCDSDDDSCCGDGEFLVHGKPQGVNPTITRIR